MREAFESQLKLVLDKIAIMGEDAGKMIGLAISSLSERDERPISQVFTLEEHVNAVQLEVDEMAAQLTVQQQPVAKDMRFIFAASRIAYEVERIADQAVNISQNTRFVLQSPPCPLPPQLTTMAQVATAMLNDGLRALAARDCSVAESVFESEKQVDSLRDEVFRELLRCIITDPLTAQRSLSLVLISRNLERIGDHVTNIAEDVIYMVRGQDIRHRFDRPTRSEGARDGKVM